MFDHLKKLKDIMTKNTIFSQYTTVIITSQAASNKFSKYYSKTKDSNETMYNFDNILDLTQKLNLYKT